MMSKNTTEKALDAIKKVTAVYTRGKIYGTVEVRFSSIRVATKHSTTPLRSVEVVTSTNLHEQKNGEDVIWSNPSRKGRNMVGGGHNRQHRGRSQSGARR